MSPPIFSPLTLTHHVSSHITTTPWDGRDILDISFTGSKDYISYDVRAAILDEDPPCWLGVQAAKSVPRINRSAAIVNRELWYFRPQSVKPDLCSRNIRMKDAEGKKRKLIFYGVSKHMYYFPCTTPVIAATF